jgi:Bacterial protein of unknown function (DUF885)
VPDPTPSPADQAFQSIAIAVIEDLLVRHPEVATMLGDHRFDDRLHVPGPDAREDERRAINAHLSALDDIDETSLDTTNRVDARILRARLDGRLFELEELRDHEWDPLLGNPGEAVYPLLAREHAPLPERLRAVAGRLAAVPEVLAAIQADLGSMPRVHVETAIGQFGGAMGLISGELDMALEDAPEMRAEVDAVRPVALEALEEHRRWLGVRLEASDRDPRIGPKLFASKLGHTMDAVTDADAILARAEADLLAVEDAIREVASRLAEPSDGGSADGLVRRVLDRAAQDHPDDASVVETATAAYMEARQFVEAEGLVTMYDDPIEVIVMPEIRRGVAIAYCDPPGPLEASTLPTFFAISPTPADWPPERRESFYREYNEHMLQDLAIHEAVPGHMLQLAHWRRFRAPTPVRSAFWSGTFVEGWAVYSERLMVEHGYRDDQLRLQQLKMQLRMIINAILDARVHAHGMTEEEAMRLMMGRGHQEEGEAVGKWRRALLTSTQLSTYYVGYTEVGDVVDDLRAARPEMSEREVLDQVLSQGCPAPRDLRTLLLPDGGATAG